MLGRAGADAFEYPQQVEPAPEVLFPAGAVAGVSVRRSGPLLDAEPQLEVDDPPDAIGSRRSWRSRSLFLGHAWQARADRSPRHPPGAQTSGTRPRSTLSGLGAVDASSTVGRARELEALEDWLDAVAAGAAGAAMLEGEAGIGKSRLAAAACESAAKRSFAVSTASADELDRGRPFGVLGDALGSRLEVPAGSVAVPGLEFRLVDQLVEQVEATALRDPALIVIEDLQWADPGTVVALRALGRRLAHLPLALLGTFRPWPRSAELDRLIGAWRDEDALHLVLGPLDQASVVALASAVLGATVGAKLEQQLESTGGNALFVRELIGALVEEGSVQLVDGRAELEAQSLPPSLRVTILRRVGLLGDRALSVLRVASVLGATFSLANLATVTRRPTAELMEELLKARAAGVIAEAGPLLRFRHALIREALYTDLPESARQALHVEAARLLAAAGAPRLLVAEQFSLGASPGDREAVSWLREAARESLLRAPQSAVALLERAVELAERGDPARDELLAELADGLVWSRRPRDGQALAEELLARSTSRSARERARETVVRGLWLDARLGEVLEHIDRWLDSGELTGAARGRGLADAAMAAAFNGDVARAESMAREALELGESLGDDAIVFQALMALGPVLNRSGRKDEQLAVAERTVEIATRGENPDPTRFHAHFVLALALESSGRLDEAETMFKTGMRVGEELGAVWHLPLYQAGLAELHCHVGRWDEALVEAETALTIGEEVGTRIAMVVYEALGARRDSARVLATMRSFGMRRGSRAAHRRALKGWDSLTATESDV